MITFKSVSIRNFLSIGNVTQALVLDTNSLTLVVGQNLDQGGDDVNAKNGTGKTTALNAICYALFGQAISSIKKDNLINVINKKNMLVTAEFEKDNKLYKIERGRKPNILRFFIDNKEQVITIDDDAQGDSRETQKDIENLIGMSVDMFKNLVALNTYSEPFLSMRVSDQRVIIEQLLGVTLLSEKAESLKNKIKETKDSITYENTKIEAIKKSNDRILESINSLKLKQRAWTTKKNTDIKQLRKSIDDLSHVNITSELLNHEALLEYTNKQQKLDQFGKEKTQTQSSLKYHHQMLSKYQNELVSLHANKCHACEQELSNHKHGELRLNHESIITDTQNQLDSLTTSLNAIIEQENVIGLLSDKPITFYPSIDQAYNHQTNLATLSSQLNTRINDIDTYQDQITELEQTALQELDWDIINKLNTLKDHQEFLLKLLSNKDSFIRKKIIDQNLSYLNNRIAYYLELLGLPHSVIFQNDLSVEITQLGQELDFHNLSRGEMTRVNLATSFSFRDVWENLYQSINLLFIDEMIDSGLDTNGVESSLKILKSMVRGRNKSVFLISHREELTNSVTNILRVIKSNGFTTYSSDYEVNDIERQTT